MTSISSLRTCVMISSSESSGGGGSRHEQLCRRSGTLPNSLDFIIGLSKKRRGPMTLQRSAAVLTDRLTHAVIVLRCEPLDFIPLDFIITMLSAIAVVLQEKNYRKMKKSLDG